MPMLRCIGLARATRSWPSSSIAPLVGYSKPAIIISVVVLPEPLGPRKVTNSPRSMSMRDVVDGVALAVVGFVDVAQRRDSPRLILSSACGRRSGHRPRRSRWPSGSALIGLRSTSCEQVAVVPGEIRQRIEAGGEALHVGRRAGRAPSRAAPRRASRRSSLRRRLRAAAACAAQSRASPRSRCRPCRTRSSGRNPDRARCRRTPRRRRARTPAPGTRSRAAADRAGRAARSNCAKARGELVVGLCRPTATRPSSVLCGMSSDTTLSTTGKPSSRAAACASASVATRTLARDRHAIGTRAAAWRRIR